VAFTLASSKAVENALAVRISAVPSNYIINRATPARRGVPAEDLGPPDVCELIRRREGVSQAFIFWGNFEHSLPRPREAGQVTSVTRRNSLDKELDKVRRASAVSVLVLHHSYKDGSAGTSSNAAMRA